MSLCKTIYQPDDCDEYEGLSNCWTNYTDEYKELKDRTKPGFRDAKLDLFLDPHMIGPCDPSMTIPLFALAVGATGNHQAERVYERMLEFAKKRGNLDTLPPFPFLTSSLLYLLLSFPPPPLTLRLEHME